MASSEISPDVLQRVDGIEVLYDTYGRIAYGLAYQIMGEQTAAEDVVQDAFISAWRSRRGFDSGKGSLKTWLLAIVRNRAIDRLRHDRASLGKDLELDAAALVVENGDPATLGADRLWIRDALKALPETQREAILLAFFGGYTHAQIAKRKGIPLGTVKGQLRLGLEKLGAMELASSVRMGQ